MKISAMRKALLLANIFNLLVALYFIIIAIIGLVQLRWYHQLTITVNVRYLLTSVTSYFAFFILIFAGLLLAAIFVTHTFRLAPRPGKLSHVRPAPDHHKSAAVVVGGRPVVVPLKGKKANTTTTTTTTTSELEETTYRIEAAAVDDHYNHQQHRAADNHHDDDEQLESTSVCCSIIVHLLATTCLVIILIIWLFNTGELVRDSISSQLDVAYGKYQFSNRSNYYTIAIDGMQDINNCCGSLEYTDFPHRGHSGLGGGHYPGSCCNKNTFGVNSRLICTPEEIWRARQTTGCTTVLANYYDLFSILIVPVALVSMFVNITIIALITILKGTGGGGGSGAANLNSYFNGNHLANYNNHQQDSELQPIQVAPPGAAGQRRPQ